MCYSQKFLVAYAIDKVVGSFPYSIRCLYLQLLDIHIRTVLELNIPRKESHTAVIKPCIIKKRCYVRKGMKKLYSGNVFDDSMGNNRIIIIGCKF